MGDDERGEFVYKSPSPDKNVPGGDTSTLLSGGQFYVVRFNMDMSGEWVALPPAASDMSAAEIAIFGGMAASEVGATTMDRPEWIAVNPIAVEGYCCPTNNRNRGVKPNGGGDDTEGDFDGMGTNLMRAGDPVTGEIRRFLTGPNGFEVTGLTWSSHRRTGRPRRISDRTERAQGNPLRPVFMCKRRSAKIRV